MSHEDDIDSTVKMPFVFLMSPNIFFCKSTAQSRVKFSRREVAVPATENNLLQDKMVSCNDYQKVTYDETILSYRSPASFDTGVRFSTALYVEF